MHIWVGTTEMFHNEKKTSLPNTLNCLEPLYKDYGSYRFALCTKSKVPILSLECVYQHEVPLNSG